MARKSRYLRYANAMKKGQAEKPALSIKGKLSQMKEKAKEVNKKPVEAQASRKISRIGAFGLREDSPEALHLTGGSYTPSKARASGTR